MELESSGCSDPLRLAAVSKAHGQRFTSRLESEYDEVANWRCMTAISVVTLTAARVVPAAGSCGRCCSSAFAVGGSASHSRTDGLRAAGYATPSGVFESHAELGDFQRLLPYVREHTFGYVLSRRSTP